MTKKVFMFNFSLLTLFGCIGLQLFVECGTLPSTTVAVEHPNPPINQGPNINDVTVDPVTDIDDILDNPINVPGALENSPTKQGETENGGDTGDKTTTKIVTPTPTPKLNITGTTAGKSPTPAPTNGTKGNPTSNQGPPPSNPTEDPKYKQGPPEPSTKLAANINTTAAPKTTLDPAKQGEKVTPTAALKTTPAPANQGNKVNTTAAPNTSLAPAKLNTTSAPKTTLAPANQDDKTNTTAAPKTTLAPANPGNKMNTTAAPKTTLALENSNHNSQDENSLGNNEDKNLPQETKSSTKATIKTTASTVQQPDKTEVAETQNTDEPGSVENIENDNSNPALEPGDNDENKNQKGDQNVKTNDVNRKPMNSKGTFYDEEEDTGGHFMAYFMTFVVLVIAGYIIYHNKQKILAFLLEGRKETGSRRRPNSKEYKKLKTEEVMPSLEKNTSDNKYIY